MTTIIQKISVIKQQFTHYNGELLLQHYETELFLISVFSIELLSASILLFYGCESLIFGFPLCGKKTDLVDVCTRRPAGIVLSKRLPPSLFILYLPLSPRNAFFPPQVHLNISPWGQLDLERVTSSRSFMYRSCLLWNLVPLFHLQFPEMGSFPCGGTFLFQAGLMHLNMSCRWDCWWNLFALMIPNWPVVFLGQGPET